MPTRNRSRVLSLLEAMATPHAVDRYLELVDPMTTVRDLRARIVAVRRAAPGSVTLTLEPTRQWRGHRAGQFVQVGVVIDGVRHTRCFSPASAEGSRVVELTVAEQDRGLVTGHLQDVQVGTVVALSQADGSFVLPDPRPESVLLVSGGSGITPVMSMLRTLLDEGFTGRVTVLHYAPTSADIPYLRELRYAHGGNVDVRIALTRSDDGDLAGHFSEEHLDAVLPGGPAAGTYLCGPPALMRAVREVYAARGVESRLHTEEFAPALAPVDEGAGGTLSFTASGASAPHCGKSLLEEAETAGLTPDYGCRMGICFTCTTVKSAGRTRNLRTGEVDDDTDKPIQLCVSAAVGDVALDL